MISRLENKRGALGLLVTAKLEVLAALEGELGLGLALRALEAQHHLLGRLCLLVEHGLGLTSVTGLLSIVTTLSLREQRGLSCLVLSDLVLSMLLAIFALAVGAASLGNVDLIVLVSDCCSRFIFNPVSRIVAVRLSSVFIVLDIYSFIAMRSANSSQVGCTGSCRKLLLSDVVLWP